MTMEMKASVVVMARGPVVEVAEARAAALLLVLRWSWQECKVGRSWEMVSGQRATCRRKLRQKGHGRSSTVQGRKCDEI